MFGGVLGLLTELAAAAPVLLVLEDLCRTRICLILLRGKRL